MNSFSKDTKENWPQIEESKKALKYEDDIYDWEEQDGCPEKRKLERTDGQNSGVINRNVKYYEWNEDMTSNAQTIIDEDSKPVDDKTVTKLENYQRLHWDVFYKNNKDNFYKDRHYIRYEFHDLVEACSKKDDGKAYKLLDFGCGVGNGFYPLVESFGFDKLTVNACDISKTAIAIVKKH